MKKIFLFAIAALMLACTTQKTYTINGTVIDIEDGNEVYLTDIATGLNIDTAVIAQSQFSFEGNADVQTIVRIASGRKMAIAVIEEGIINVTLAKESNFSGTPLNDTLSAYFTQIQDVTKAFQAYIDQVKADNPEDQKLQNDIIRKYYSETYLKSMEEINKSFLAANTGNILAVYVFSNSLPADATVADIDAFILTNPYAATYAPIVALKASMINLENTSAGKMFTDFTVRNIENTADVKLSDFVGKGKYVLVDFWASWCGPCKKEIPNLKLLQDKYGKKMTILGVNVWDKHDAAIKSIEDYKMDWTNIYGSDSRVATDLYGIKGIPTIILFSPDGTIVDRTLRGEKMVEYIENLMK